MVPRFMLIVVVEYETLALRPVPNFLAHLDGAVSARNLYSKMTAQSHIRWTTMGLNGSMRAHSRHIHQSRESSYGVVALNDPGDRWTQFAVLLVLSTTLVEHEHLP